MWSPLSRLAPFLLATSNSVWPPKSPQDLTEIFRKEYQDLEKPGAIYHQVTPTLRFSYVSPRSQNGTSTWRNPSIDDKLLLPDPNKPIVVYIPGLDGYGISAHQYQFDDLATPFNLWRLTIAGEDRSSFLDVVNATRGFVQQLHNNYSNKVILIGESCGGVIAAAATLRLKHANVVQGLVLVNPATSFDQTVWDRLVPLLWSLKYFDTPESTLGGLTPYSVIGSLLLSTVIPDWDQYRRLIDLIVNLPSISIPPSSPQQLQGVLDAAMDGFRETEFRLPPELLEHRVQWLVTGARAVRNRLRQLHNVPTLLVAGQQDKLLPSAREAEELLQLIPQSEKVVVRNRGHFVLDENVNLTEAILYSNIDPLNWKTTKKRFDPVLDWKYPSEDEAREAVEKASRPFRQFHSPIFFSTDETGKRWKDLGKIPRPNRSLLIVGNHQFGAADLRPVVAEMYEQRGILPRGLAHPVTFIGTKDKPGELFGRTPGILNSGNPVNGDFQQFGAIEVNPKNYYRVLQAGQDALLFPGGAKEAFSGRADYPLFWPDKVDFVRTAAKFNATVVPLSAVGILDSVTVLAEPPELLKVPILGNYLRAFQKNVTAARYDAADEDEVIGFPLAVPKMASRNYFVFGKPFNLENLDHNDKEACERVYREIQAEVRRGLDDIIRAREHDPFFKNAARRLAYERVFGKTAPTFPVDVLNET